MSVTYTGAELVSYPEYSYSQDIGYTFRVREKGIPSVIDGRAAQWVSAGWDVTTTRNGPYSELVASRVNSGDSGAYVERWSVATQIVEKSIWSLPEVVEEMDVTYGGKQFYTAKIEEAVESGESLHPSISALPWANIVLYELRRGVEAYEHEYTTLTREIQFSTVNYPVILTLNDGKQIYSSTELQATFNVPSDVMFTLPSDPSTTTQSKWGWRITSQEADIGTDNGGAHRTTWTYANWSTLLYNA